MSDKRELCADGKKIRTCRRFLPGRKLLAAGGALVLVAVAAPAGAAAGQTAAGPAAASVHTLVWNDCPQPGAVAGAQCASLRVPLDWQRPKGQQISLALARLPALDPRHRVGPLLFNPGGPGGSGVQAVGYSDLLAAAPEFAPLRQRFDVIGFDPRGVGSSTPINCAEPLHDPSISTFPHTVAGFQRLKELNRRAGDSCRHETGPLIDHVDTLSVVRDVEAIRLALNADRISWLGLSYGTEIGSLYAERYPKRVRAMVLDGVVDHSLPTRRAVVDEARAIETALQRFATWCQSDEQCVLRGLDVLGVFDQLMATAQHAGVPASNLQRNVTAEEITNGAYTYLSQRAAWPLLAGALATAAGLGGEPDAAGLVAAASFVNPEYDAYRTVGCHDFDPGTRGFLDLTGQVAIVRAVAPHTWRYSEFWDWTSGCLGWPVAAANPPRPLRVHGTPPILLVNTRHDPATPYAWAQRVATRISGSRLLTVEGDGHTGILNSSCARSHEANYLTTGSLPAAGATCAESIAPVTAAAIRGPSR